MLAGHSKSFSSGLGFLDLLDPDHARRLQRSFSRSRLSRGALAESILFDFQSADLWQNSKISSGRRQGISMIPLKIGEFTSSTAQGGGGSFKNRKPIGEIGCCESRMAERIH